MGFLKNIFIKILPLLFLAGCSGSVIKINVPEDLNPYSMFGGNAHRNFYLPEVISDSLKKLWDTDLYGGLTNSSATVYGDYLFINDLSGRVTCIDINNGDIAGELKNHGGAYSSPVLHNFNVIYPLVQYNENFSSLYYYDFKEGVQKKDIKIPGKITCELLKTKGNIIFNTEEGAVYKYDPDGNKIWECDTHTGTHSSPAAGDGIVVFGNNDGEIIGIEEKDGRLLYQKKIGDPFYGSPSVSGDTVYIGNDDGKLYALDLRTGSIVWRYQTGSRIISVPVFNQSQVFVCNLGGDLFALNKFDGGLLWKMSTGGVLNATPLLTKNYLILPDLEGKLYFIDPSDGNTIKKIKMNGRCKISPIIVGNKLIAGYGYKTIAAYEFIR